MSPDRRFLIFSWFVAALAFGTPASAHTVGLSKSEYVVDGRYVTATLTFARAEAEALARGDREAFSTLVVDETTVEGDGNRCDGSLDSMTLDEADGLLVRARYRCGVAPLRVRVHMGFLAQLPAAHREIARIVIGPTTTETILYRGHEEIAAGEAQARSSSPRVLPFVRMGIEHILTGYDHLVFLFGLVLVGGRTRSLVAAVTAFTAAHSITLALAVLGICTPPARLVELAVALSIVWVGVENVFVESARGRWRITLPFGFIHGFAFASALRQVDLLPKSLAVTLFSFNAGVELGQLAVLGLVVPVLFALRKRGVLERRGTRILSGLVACGGAVLFAARALDWT